MSLVSLVYDGSDYELRNEMRSLKADGFKYRELFKIDGPILSRWTKATATCAGERKTLPQVFASPLIVEDSVKKWFEANSFAGGLEFLPVTILTKDEEKIADYFWIRPTSITDCIDMSASKAKLNSIDKWTISSCSGLVMDLTKVPQNQFVFRVSHVETLTFVSKEVAERLQTQNFSGLALVEPMQFTAGFSWKEPFYRASQNGSKEKPLPAALTQPKLSAIETKSKVANIEREFLGKHFLLKPKYVESFLHRESSNSVTLEFFESSKLKKYLINEYADYLYELKVLNEEKWSSEFIVPIGGFYLTPKSKTAKKKDVSSCEAWLFFDGAKDNFFITTSDNWQKTSLVKVLNDLFE